MSLLSFIKHPVLTICFFTVQGSIDIFLFLEPWIISQSESNEFIFHPEFVSEALALVAKANHLFAISKLLQKLIGQSDQCARVNGQCHKPGQLLHNLIGRTPQEGSLCVESDLSIKIVLNCI